MLPVGMDGVPVKTGEASGAKLVATKAVVASLVELSATGGVGPEGVPVNVGLAVRAPPTPVTSAACKVTVPVLPLNVLTIFVVRAVATKAVVAICVELVPAVAVGAVGVPVIFGETMGAPPAPVTSAVVRVTAPVRPLKLA